MFSFITEVPLAEYIRRRRLTLAAFELQSSDIKVIDLALKYVDVSDRLKHFSTKTAVKIK